MTSEERGIVTDLGRCDFTAVSNYFKMKSEERKARSKEEKLVSQTCQAFRNNVSETEKQDRSPLFIHGCITAAIPFFVCCFWLSYTNCVLAWLVCFGCKNNIFCLLLSNSSTHNSPLPDRYLTFRRKRKRRTMRWWRSTATATGITIARRSATSNSSPPDCSAREGTIPRWES